MWIKIIVIYLFVEKLSIISNKVSGIHAGYVKGSPDIKAVGMTPVEMVSNIFHITREQKKLEKEKK